MELVNTIIEETSYINDTLRAYPEFDSTEILVGQYQGLFNNTKSDKIFINALIPSIGTNSTCRKQILTTILIQLKLNFCIKRNPNYEIYYDVIEVLKLNTNYTDYLSSEMSIENGRGLVTINASRTGVLLL